MRLLVLVTDAFGGRGGIAKFNRDLLSALSMHTACTEVVALPRLVQEDVHVLPERLTYRLDSTGGRRAYVSALVSTLTRGGRFDGVVCGHINLLPLAFPAARWKRVPLLLIVHGIEAWQPPNRRLTDRLVARVDAFAAVSDTTRQRLMSWAGLHDVPSFVVPNCIDPSLFGPGPKRADLLARHGLAGKKVIMTLGRLSAREQYKGIDEVLEVLPDLAREMPDITYLVAGDGDDRPRLQKKAERLGLREHVVFAGYVPEEEKSDYYRLADAFVMPGRGEGFGIVYLEAMACGIPVVASTADASREAVRNGEAGIVVDPGDAGAIRAGIRSALGCAGGGVPAGLSYFSFERFVQRWHEVVDQVF